MLAGFDVATIPLEILSFVLLIYGGIIVPMPHQPLAVMYEPRNLATRLLKWISAPQVEAVILLWFGWSFLIQPEQISAVRLSGSVVVSFTLGIMFLAFGWLMVVQLPSPLEYTLLTSTRLAYTLVVARDVWINDITIMVIGAYIGCIAWRGFDLAVMDDP